MSTSQSSQQVHVVLADAQFLVIAQAVAIEETALEVRVLDLIEVFDRIFPAETSNEAASDRGAKFHYVIVDYLCERISGEPRAGSDVTDVVFAREDELTNYHLTPTATRVLRKAFAMARERQNAR